MVEGFNGLDLGLLEHGFGEPDGVGIAGFPPGHGAFVGVEPGEEASGEAGEGDFFRGCGHDSQSIVASGFMDNSGVG